MRTSLLLAAVLGAFGVAGAAVAQSAPDPKPGAVAYPNNPAGTPVSDDKGAPVVTDKAACPGAGKSRCPESPPPSGSASEGSPASQAGVAAKN